LKVGKGDRGREETGGREKKRGHLTGKGGGGAKKIMHRGKWRNTWRRAEQRGATVQYRRRLENDMHVHFKCRE